ncbi:MAG: site-specific DNA-methyltransferase [Chloroflexi bacterium]|nr:site-specific DNA-methyltransferase [Chloroflexota bacterium]
MQARISQRTSDAHVKQTLQEIAGTRKRAQTIDSAALHPFPARMPLGIAEHLVEQLSEPGAVVLDPMVGSGTTISAARKLRRLGLGFDLDLLAVLLSQAACASAASDVLEAAGERVFSRAQEVLLRQDASLNGPLAALGDEDRAFISYWFPERSQRELSALAFAIRSEQNHVAREFLWAVFSSLIIAKSSGASYALDLAHTRPHRSFDKKIAWPLESWPVRFRRALSKLKSSTPGSNVGRADAWLGDARHMPLRDSSVDLVLTSPPYLQAIDYMRSHKFALVWMGHDLAHLRRIRSTMIGTQRGLSSPDGIPESVEMLLSTSVSLQSRRDKVRRYTSDIHAMLAEVHRVLKPGALAVLATGPSLFSRQRHDARDILEQLAASVGMTVVSAEVRRLNDSRRVLPPPRKSPSGNDLRKRMRSELFIALRKLSNF